jgi:hypothetical protein
MCLVLPTVFKLLLVYNHSTQTTMCSLLVLDIFVKWYVVSVLQTVLCFPYLGGVIELGVTELVIFCGTRVLNFSV